MVDNNLKKTALKAVDVASKILVREYYKFQRCDAKFKTKHEILTQADLKANQAIIKIIEQTFPKHQILSEETGQNKNLSDYLWIIDPLDGTTNFSMHNPLWATSLALAHKNKVILGIVKAPLLQETFVAIKDKGAYLNDKKIKVSKNRTKNVIHAFCHSRETKDIKRAINYYKQQKLYHLDCRQMGSASVELAFVAAGRVESITIPGANSWDVAAGILLVREAGGKVTDFKNKNWTLQSPDMIASNKLTHQQIISAIK